MNLVDLWVRHVVDAKGAEASEVASLKAAIEALERTSCDSLSAERDRLVQELSAVTAEVTMLEARWADEVDQPAAALRARCLELVDQLPVHAEVAEWVAVIEQWHAERGRPFEPHADPAGIAERLGMIEDIWDARVTPWLAATKEDQPPGDVLPQGVEPEHLRQRIVRQLQENAELLGRTGTDLLRLVELTAPDRVGVVLEIAEQLERRLAPLATSATLEAVMLERP